MPIMLKKLFFFAKQSRYIGCKDRADIVKYLETEQRLWEAYLQ